MKNLPRVRTKRPRPQINKRCANKTRDRIRERERERDRQKERGGGKERERESESAGLAACPTSMQLMLDYYQKRTESSEGQNKTTRI